MRGPIYIAGPTASGKSSVALLLAERLHGEIISADSMQVYRGLDIGTAKPSFEERARVPHHLVDVVDPDQPFDAGQFLNLARQAETAIQSRGRLPIYCGGTGLYLKALVAGIGQSPPSDPKLRADLEANPLSELLIELAERDPETFRAIDRSNPRRVIRAVEVIRLTGVKYSAHRAHWSKTRSKTQQGRWFGLRRERADLIRRIEGRVDQMFTQGLVSETRALLARGLAGNRTALQSLGYRQVAEHLQGVRDLAGTIESVKVKTRQFAKRQMTWFNRQLELEWIPVPPDESAELVAAQIEARLLDQPSVAR